ncbi:MAG: Gx transporter family protein [Oscillospiraceae bacterium]|jgi:heptaprenyl diphosphate synthase|nr:Gx transporter family protein [Oscillospiraceae bacterium]
MKNNRTLAKRLTTQAMLVAAAVVLGGIERLIPPFFPAMPGVKIGLANLATLAALYWLGEIPAIAIAVARILLGTFLFASVSALPYALAGGVLAWAVMCVGRRVFGVPGVSLLGAVAHNLAQICVSVWLLDSTVLFMYIPFLTIIACATGFVLGFVMLNLDNHIRKTSLLTNI